MFIGHYGVAFGARAVDKRIPLWVYFLAVQWVDIMWCVLVLLGVERVHIQPGVNPSSPLVFDYYPYTHSLAAGLVWALAAYGAYRLIARARAARAAGVMLALAVLSHWLLDFVVHLPDLDLVSESHKVGLGLWLHPVIETVVEAALVIAGLALYLRRSPQLPLRRRIALVALCLGIGALQIGGAFGPPPPSVRAMALAGLALYLLAAALARAAEGPPRPSARRYHGVPASSRL
jgi:hypothetical protein